MLKALVAYRRAGKQLPPTEQMALVLGQLDKQPVSRDQPVNREEWQARTDRAARECAEERELHKLQRTRRGSQYRRIYEQVRGPIPEGYHVHHKDGNHKNNHPSNLEAVKPRVHRMKHELMEGGRPYPIIYQYPSKKRPGGRAAPN